MNWIVSHHQEIINLDLVVSIEIGGHDLEGTFVVVALVIGRTFDLTAPLQYEKALAKWNEYIGYLGAAEMTL